MNVGEQLVASYLRYIRGCDFTQLNLYTVESQGEIDVIGINLRQRKVYICEVAIHLTTGLQYVYNKQPNNVNKLVSKFLKDIQYANSFFADYEKHFMLWTPVIKKGEQGSLHCQTTDLEKINSTLSQDYNVRVEFVVNGVFLEYMNEMRAYAKSTTAELKCPVMRLFQIEEHLAKHVSKSQD